MTAVLAVQASDATAVGGVTASNGAQAHVRAGQAGSAGFESTLEQADLPRNTATKTGESDNPYVKLETMFVSQLISTMLSTSGSSMFGEGEGGMKAFSSVFAGAIGEEVVKHGGFGLAETIAHDKPA